MDSFDIGRLTDFDFESICKDIFEEILDARLEIFSPGADDGVDLRHLKQSNNSSIIIQCKHWSRTDRSKLIKQIKDKELPKVKKLNPSRYILATSTELTKHAKDTIAKTLAPYLRSSMDVFGINEIESELRKRPHIVRRHTRLWLNSTAILQSLINKEVLIRSSSLADDLKNSLEFYVPNESLPKAQQLLESEHIVIISGIPGIGKTTLAHVLAAEYISRGFSLIEISEDAEEANKLWNDKELQVFFYDDFLGQTTLADKLHKNEDSRLLSLLRRINSTPEKRFILTTREYILKQAQQRYEKISRADFSPMTCVLDLDNYTKQIRAQILYNHVYFSSLPPKNKEGFANSSIYLPIIDNRNFNPRIIRLSLDAHNPGESPELTTERLINNLKNPSQIWQHIVENQLDDSSVSVLELLFSLASPKTNFDSLKRAYFSYSHDKSASTSKLRRALQILEGTFLRITITNNRQYLEFSNPSARDYMREHLSSRPEVVTELLESAVYFEQVQKIWTVSAGYKGTDILSSLLSSPQILEEAVLRTAQSKHSLYRDSRDLVGRSISILDITQKIESDKLYKTLNEQIFPQIDLSIETEDLDDVVRLISNLAKSESEQLQSWAELLVEKAIDYILEDVSDWDNLEFADAILADLEHIPNDKVIKAAEAARTYVFEKLTDHVAIIFERYSQDLYVSPEELEAAVGFASQLSNPYSLFDSYGLISANVDNAREMRRSSQARPSGVSVPTENTPVDEIMGCLRGVRSTD